MNGNIEHHLSKDGSSTLYSEEFHQFYHNPNGAVSESEHVFFETPGVYDALENATSPISFFEMGFGTGLNYLLLLEACQKFEVTVPISFYTVEAFPANPEVIASCNYGDLLDTPPFQTHLVEIFKSLKPGWNSAEVFPGSSVHLHVYFGTFDELTPPQTPINFVFHDPFSPEVNGELWTPNIFSRIKDFCVDDAVLTTYCAASKARAAMAKAGWKVVRAPGALGKREMSLASLSEEKLTGFKRLNEERLIERWDSRDFE